MHKPNVTIRITCPGSQDVAAESYTGPTLNLLATVHEKDFGPLMFVGSGAFPLPAHIYGAFKAMIDSSDSNRIEIMQGITSYSCYRHPLGEISRSEQEYKAQNLNRTGAGSQPIQGEVSKVCFENCEDRKEGETRCTDCPLAGLDDLDKFIVKLDQGKGQGVTCGGSCPHARRCLSFNRCLAEFPQKKGEDPIDYDTKS